MTQKNFKILENSDFLVLGPIFVYFLLTCICHATGIILCMRPANERRRYNVTSSLIGWAHIQNDPWCFTRYDEHAVCMLFNWLCLYWNSIWTGASTVVGVPDWCRMPCWHGHWQVGWRRIYCNSLKKMGERLFIFFSVAVNLENLLCEKDLNRFQISGSWGSMHPIFFNGFPP